MVSQEGEERALLKIAQSNMAVKKKPHKTKTTTAKNQTTNPKNQKKPLNPLAYCGMNFPWKLCLNELRPLSPAFVPVSRWERAEVPSTGALAVTQGLGAPISSALVLSARIRMRKHLVLRPGCIRAPCLQVCASAGRGICPEAGRKKHRFRSVPELRMNCSEQLSQWSVQDISYLKIVKIRKLFAIQNLSWFQLLLNILSALCGDNFWSCPSIACGVPNSSKEKLMLSRRPSVLLTVWCYYTQNSACVIDNVITHHTRPVSFLEKKKSKNQPLKTICILIYQLLSP